jgi:hypothetical protein
MRLVERRGWDLNPRATFRPPTVFKSAADWSAYGRKRSLRSASVRLDAVRCAQVGTKFGTEFLDDQGGPDE